jgi:hypothetical protein
MSCSKYHKVLTATKWHSVVSIEKYESLLPILKTEQITCIQHQDKLFEYFCVTHDCPCCIQCKRSAHSTCQDVEKIEEVVKAVNLSEEFISLNSKIGNSLKILEKLFKNRDQNILKLRSQREDLYKKLKINRDLIDKALNVFETDTKCVLENNFDKEKGVILEQESEITSKIADLKHNQYQIESILDIEVESNIQFFLFQNKAKEQMKQNKTDIDNMLASLLDISSACTLSTEIDHAIQSVRMLKTLEFQRRICSLDLELEHDSDEDNEITASSTVEADDILKTSDLNLQLADATPITSVKLLKDVTPQLPSVKLLKDVTPQQPSVKLLKDVTPQLPNAKLFKDVTPQPPNVKLLKDVTPQLPGVNLLKDVSPQLSSVKLLKDVTPQLPSVKLFKDVTVQPPNIKLLKDVTPQLPNAKLFKDVTPQPPNVKLLKDVTPQLPNSKLLKDVTPQLPSVKLLKDVTPQLLSVKLLKDVTPQLPSVKLLKDVTPELPNAKGLIKDVTPLKRETLFRYKSHFTFDTTEFMSESLNPFIKVVSNNRVVITGSQNTKLLFFTKSGEKQGELKLDYSATSAAVIDDKTVAVAAHLEVVFVDTQTFKRIDSIPMQDKCIGIAYVNNQLFVNCITRGLIIMNRSGNIAQKLKSITGSMHISTLDDNTIVLFNQLSNKIECLDIPTSRKTSYIQVQDTHGPKCVTSDRNGNIFIAVKDEIFFTHPASSSEYSTILSKPYDIIRPLCIDIDIKSHELFVLNNDGKSVYCFQKQMDDV